MPIVQRRRRIRKLRPRKAKSTRAIAKRGFRLAKTLASTREVKYETSGVATTGSITTGVVNNLLPISQGDSANTRDGNQITLRSLRLNGLFSNNNGTTITDSLAYRIILFQDKQQVSDMSPQVSDVLSQASVIGMYNYPDVVKRFKILYDRSFTINAQAADGTSGPYTVQKTWTHWLFPTMKNVKFNGTAGSDLQKGGVYMLMISDSPDFQFNINWQISFNDS